MREEAEVADSSADPPTSWMAVDPDAYSGDGPVVVTVRGHASTEHTEEVWATVEEILERGSGRRVLLDLTGVSGFDPDCVETVREILLAASRRHDDVTALVQRGSALAEQLERVAAATGWADRLTYAIDTMITQRSRPTGPDKT